MHKHNLPTYAIVELLIRLEKFNPAIGGYKNHSVSDTAVVVKTSGGSITFPQQLVTQQFESPELITDNLLADAASGFKPSN